MAILLRKEWFGGIIAKTENYDIRVMNRFSFSSFEDAILSDGVLTSHHEKLLEDVGFFAGGAPPRLISGNIGDRSPILSAPIILWLEVTSACPLRCKHCFIGCGKETKPAFLPFPIVERTLEDAAQLGIVRVTLSGGEAFLYPFIQQAISKVNTLGMGLRIFTNGVLKKSNLSWLGNYDVDALFISVDGSQEHHEYLRGANTFRHVSKTIPWLCSIDSIKNVTLSVCLDKHNVSQFAGILEVCRENGIRTVLIRPLMGYLWTKKIDNLVFRNKRELFDALSVVIEQANQNDIEIQINKIPHMPLDRRIFLEEHRENASLSNILGVSDSIDCVGGNLVCGIRYDGYISPCGFIDLEIERTPDNSIFHRSLLELWKSSSNLRRMRNIPLNPGCRNCSMVTTCNGGCRANAFNLKKDMSGIDPYCLYMKTDYGEKVLEHRNLKRHMSFPVAANDHFISRKRLVSKCGWATYE